MWIFLLLSAGLFMGWSLGTNDAANAFGTAVATRVVKYRTAIIIIAIMVVLGALTLGHNNIDKLARIATNNEVSASIEDVEAALEAGGVVRQDGRLVEARRARACEMERAGTGLHVR